MYTIQIRFNTEHNGSALKWRVLVNGTQHLARRVVCTGTFETTEDVLPGNVVKHHVTIVTPHAPRWQDDEVFIGA